MTKADACDHGACEHVRCGVIQTFTVGNAAVAWWWIGWRGSLARYRWGITTGHGSASVHAGPLRIVTGPAQ